MQTDLYGVYRAVVVSVRDPLNKRRIRVKAPQVSGNVELNWAEPVNASSQVPAVNTVVWVMFNGGYINKPVWFPSEEELQWVTPTLVSGYDHNGNLEGTVQYTTYTFHGTRYMEWRGGLDVTPSGSEGSYSIPNSGLFFTLTDTHLRPPERRTATCAKNLYSSANFVNNTAKIDFNDNGNCVIINSASYQTAWISLHGVRYTLD